MFSLPQLAYKYSELEPHIDAQTMEIHHTKHHQGYVNKLNAAVSGTEWTEVSVEKLLRSIDQIPEKIRDTVRNNGGGHANHSLFWEILTPGGNPLPEAALKEKIVRHFDSLEKLIELFSDKAASRFGSGWAWLVVKKDNTLDIFSTANQDSPLMHDDTPILCLDVWEHAYYLNYQNKRAEYVKAFWNLVNWEQVSENFSKATS